MFWTIPFPPLMHDIIYGWSPTVTKPKPKPKPNSQECTHLTDVVAAVAHLGRTRSICRAARPVRSRPVEERVVLRKRVSTTRSDCKKR